MTRLANEIFFVIVIQENAGLNLALVHFDGGGCIPFSSGHWGMHTACEPWQNLANFSLRLVETGSIIILSSLFILLMNTKNL